MNKDHLIGFLTASCLFLFLGATGQINNQFKTNESLFNEIANIYGEMQRKQFDLYTTTPTANMLRERQFVFVKNSHQFKLWFSQW